MGYLHPHLLIAGTQVLIHHSGNTQQRLPQPPVSRWKRPWRSLEPGQLTEGSDIWTEGSGLVCNYVRQINKPHSPWRTLWTGVSYRNRRFKFGLDTYEVTAGSDVGDGAHHVMAVWDQSAGTMTLYVDARRSGKPPASPRH